MYEYPFGNGQQLNLDWFLAEWKNLLVAWEAEKNGIEGALQAEIDRAEAALADVFTARDAAAQSASAAGNSASAAAESASDASGYLSTVQQNATAAQDAARNAAQSESNASDSAQTALASKNAAGQSERNAAQSEANALASKDAAAQSVADALANKDAAAQSAADALADKNAAAQSASDAAQSAEDAEAAAISIIPFPLAIPLRKILNPDFTTPVAYGRHIIEKYEHIKLAMDYNAGNSQKISLKNGAGTYQNLDSVKLTDITVNDFWQLPDSLKNDQLKLNLIYIPDNNNKPYQLVLYSCWADIEDETINILHSTRTQIALANSTTKATQIIKDIPMYEDANYLALYIGSGGSNITGDIYFFLNTPTNTALALSN